MLQAFFTDRLIAQRHASSHTIAGYSSTFRLLLGFATATSGKTPWLWTSLTSTRR